MPVFSKPTATTAGSALDTSTETGTGSVTSSPSEAAAAAALVGIQNPCAESKFFGDRDYGPCNQLNVSSETRVYIYYDRSGSLEDEIPNLQAAMADLIDLLVAEGVPRDQITEYNPNNERYVNWLQHDQDDFVVLTVINESNSIYHSTTSDSGPKAQWTNDYNSALPFLQAASNFRALVYGIESPSWSSQSEINTFFTKHLPRAIEGLASDFGSYPSSPSLYDLGVRYQVNVPSGQSAEEYLNDIRAFLTGGQAPLDYDRDGPKGAVVDSVFNPGRNYGTPEGFTNGFSQGFQVPH